MNTIRRDGADDTGNQDVRGLRRHFLGGNGAPQEMPKEASTPHLRDKEDVPHEGSIPDFYGLADPFEDTAEGQIEAVLLKMVDEGELCFGWIEERQEMGFWRCDDAESSASCCPTPEPAPQRVSHRRAPTTRQRVMSRAMVTMVAAVATPFAIGVGAYAVDQAREQHKPTVEQTDLAAEETPSQTPAAKPTVAKAPAPLPTVNSNSARGGIPEPKHKKPDHHEHHRHHLLGGHQGHHYVGRHRRDGDRDDTPLAPSTAPVNTLTRPTATPSPTATPRTTLLSGRRDTGLVSEVFQPVESLLGRTFR
jgi:hypothetical protein